MKNENNTADNRIKVLIAASEFAPLAKTGGLADVIGTLPGELRSLGIDARVVIPLHREIKDRFSPEIKHITSFYTDIGWRRQYVGVETMEYGGLPLYFIDNERYFGEKIYKGGNEEGEQYAYFQRAILEMLPRIDFFPNILHCNDWHTAAIPMLIKTQYSNLLQNGIKTLLTIHNIAYQGRYSPDFVSDVLSVPYEYMTSEYIESYGSASFMKAGCVFSDRVNTVSPTYALEIKTPEYGEGLDGVLQQRGNTLIGILNGIDRVSYDPRRDSMLPAKLENSVQEWKRHCKAELCSELGLNYTDRPLIGMVARLTEQKGLDLLDEAIDRLMAMDIRFVLVGTGEPCYEKRMREAENRCKGRLCAYIKHDEAVARRVYAASDMFLMPSRFEPCGISQMIAMRYGSIPIVRETGGLRDTVLPFNYLTGSGNGFTFRQYTADDMVNAVGRAVDLYENRREAFNTLIENAMAEDFSFAASARKYAGLYDELI